MGKNKKKLKERKLNEKKNQLNEYTKLKSNEKEYISFSFKDIDKNQGINFKEISEEVKIEIFDKLYEYSKFKIQECFSSKFKEYDSFPKNSNFKHPKHIPEDAIWCSMHIQGKECLIFHRVKTVFHLVFIDLEHEFYITNKKHT